VVTFAADQATEGDAILALIIVCALCLAFAWWGDQD
jgi:hypothetical protein